MHPGTASPGQLMSSSGTERQQNMTGRAGHSGVMSRITVFLILVCLMFSQKVFAVPLVGQGQPRPSWACS
jgi:preprotein translocase subunit SecG